MLDPARRRPELRALTSMRGIAAIAVVLQHFCATAQLHSDGWLPSVVGHGYLAVDFFFVLSGFIMSYTYLAGFEALGMAAYGPFLWKRVARVVPLGLAVTATILVLAALCWPFGLGWLFASPHGGLDLLAKIAVNVLHLQGFLPDYNVNDPSWSISVELGAYLLFPLLIVLMFRAPPAVTALCVALGAALLVHISTFAPDSSLAYRWPPFDFGRCVAEFCFGMLVYRAYASPSVLHRLGQDRWTVVVVLVLALGWGLRADLLTAATFPFLVLAFALNRGRCGRALGGPVLHYLGMISFSIYLVHNLFRTPDFWLAHRLHPGPLPPAMALAVALVGSVCTLPFAALAYAYVEKPGRDAVNRLVRQVPWRRASAEKISSVG